MVGKVSGLLLRMEREKKKAKRLEYV